MSDGYGVCVYESGDDGVLSATWCADGTTTIGTGRAVPKGAVQGYTGEYIVTYFNAVGEVDAEFDLSIRQDGESYRLEWVLDGKTLSEGVGIEHGDALIVSYVNKG